MQTNFRKRLISIIYLLIAFILVWIASVNMVAPTFNSDDSPETTVAFQTMGIQHPPGYPLDTLIGKIFTMIPVGNVMFRSNLMAMFFNIITAFFIFIFVKINLRIDTKESLVNYIFAGLSALFYLFSNSVFLQSTFAKGSIYTLNSFFTITIVALLLNLKKNIKYFFLFSFLYGLSLGNHWQSIIVIFPAVAFYLFINWKYLNAGAIVKSIFFFMIGISIYIFIFIRSTEQPIYSWGDIKSLKDFIWLISRAQYSTVEGVHTIHNTINLLRFYINDLFSSQYPFFIAIFLFPGGYFLLKKLRTETITILIAYLFLIASVVRFATPPPNTEWLIKAYLISSYIFIAIFMSAGICYIINSIKGLSNIVKLSVYLLVTVIIIISLRLHVPDYSRYFIGYDYSENIVKSMPQGSIFIAEGDMNIGAALYERLIKKENFISIIPVVLGYSWYRDQLMRIYDGDLKLAPLAPNMIEELNNIMMNNKEKNIYYSNVYTKEWQKLLLKPEGIVYKVLTDTSIKNYVSDANFNIYSYRGIIDNGVKYDDFTKRLVVENYGVSYYMTGDIFRKSGRNDVAVKLYKNGFVFLPSDSALLNIGICYYTMKDMPNAEKYWREALELNPRLSVAYSNLAFIYLNKNETAKALEYVDKALEYDQNNSSARQLKDVLNKAGIHR